MRILANLNVAGTLDIDTVTNAGADTDRFLVQDANGVVRYRTGAEVASDIGAAVGFVSTVKHLVKLGENISKGQAVYVSGSNGTNMIVMKASNASEATSSKTFGLLETGGVTNDEVYVVTEGLLAGLDTSTANAGDPVWLGTNGDLIFGLANKPYAPAHLVFIGIVTRKQQQNGEIFVKVQNGFELQELHNVQITTTPANNTVLAYETSSSLYKMKSIATLLGYTPADDAGVVHLAGTETITGTKTFTAATTTFAKVVANAPFGGATGEGIVVGKSFKLDASGEGESAKIYVVTKDLSDTYGSGLQIQFANIDDNKGFGFNLNTAGGYEIYTKDAGAAWVKAMTISNTQLATFHGNVRLAAYTTNGFVKTSSSNGTITIDPAAFTLTTTGTNGPATYNSGTGVLNIPEYLGASGIRIVYNFTATAGQTTFTVTSYTPGVIDVYYNGSRLTEDEYTATNGTTIVLDTACAVGDLVDVIVYQGSINGFTGVGGSGTINQLTYWTGANTIGALSTATYPSLTEISYVKGVTSAIQTQLDAKVPTSRTLTINGTSYDLSANRSWTISGVTGSGTANQIAYWDGSSSVAGSTFLTLNLTADNGYLILTGGATYKNADIWLNRYSDAWENAIRFQTNGTTDWYLGSSATGSNSNLEFYSYGTTSAALTLLKASANANFGASVGIGNTTLTGYSLRVSRTMVGDTASGITSFGVVSDGTVQSAVTSGAFGFNSALSTAAAAFTLDSLIHFRATQGTIGNTSAVTNQYGFAALGTMTGATNNYGFFGSLDSATGRWNLYMSGTARNYLAGDTSIGTTTGGYKLNVSGTSNFSGALTGTAGTFSDTLTGTGLRSFAVNTAQTPSNNAGWYTLARFNTYAPFLNTNGNSGIITLSFYGGGIYTPSRYRIFYFKDDANVATLKLEKYGAVDYIQEVRIRYRTGDTRYYIEIYCDSHASGLTFDVHHDRLFGYGDQLEIFGGVLSAANAVGTILASLPFVDHGTTMSSLNVVTSASFSSALTANSFVKSGGIASQFLKADGTVDSTTYQPALTNPVTGTGTLNYLPKFTVTGSAIGNSLVYDNGSTVFIGTTTTSTQYTSEEFVVTGGSYTNVEFRGTSQAALALTKGTNSTASSPAVEIFNSGNFGIVAYRPTVVSSNYIIYYALESTSNRSLAFQTEGSDRLTLNQAGTVRLNYYTTNGFVKFSGGDGTLSVDTNTYLTAESDTLASVTGRGASTATAITLSNAAPLTFTNNSNTGTYTRTVYYYNQNNTSNNNANGVFIERGRITDAADGEIRNFIIGARGGSIQFKVDKDGGVWSMPGSNAGTFNLSDDGAGLYRNNTYDVILHQSNSSGSPLYLSGAGNVVVSIDNNNNETDRKFIVGSNAVKSSNELFSVNESGQGYFSSSVTATGASIGRVVLDYDGTDSWFRMQSGNRMRITTTGGTDFIIPNTGNMTYNGSTVWHAGNDGSGSGLDADLLDGRDSGGYLTHVYSGFSFPTGTHTGWYRIARSSQAVGGAGLRGGFKIIVAATGNYLTPAQDEITGFKDWTTTLHIQSVMSSGSTPFTNYRLTYDADYTYLEGYINAYFGGDQSIAVQSFHWGLNGLTWTPHTGNAVASTTSLGATSIGKTANASTFAYLVSANGATINGLTQIYGTLRATGGGGQIDADIDDGAFRFYNGSTFRGGLGTDRWAHSGSAVDTTMYINGDNKFFISTNSVKRVRVDSGGIICSSDIVAYGSPSDITLKTVKSKVDNAVEKVSKLNGYYFDWKDVDSLTNIKEDIGVIAQEVQQIFPELARTNENGKMSVRYQGLTAVLIEAIKELAEENKQIKEELSKLKN